MLEKIIDGAGFLIQPDGSIIDKTNNATGKPFRDEFKIGFTYDDGRSIEFSEKNEKMVTTIKLDNNLRISYIEEIDYGHEDISITVMFELSNGKKYSIEINPVINPICADIWVWFTHNDKIHEESISFSKNQESYHISKDYINYLPPNGYLNLSDWLFLVNDSDWIDIYDEIVQYTAELSCFNKEDYKELGQILDRAFDIIRPVLEIKIKEFINFDYKYKFNPKKKSRILDQYRKQL